MSEQTETTEMTMQEKRNLVRDARGLLKMTYAQFGALVGLSESMVFRFEKGERELTAEKWNAVWNMILDKLEPALAENAKKLEARLDHQEREAARLQRELVEHGAKFSFPGVSGFKDLIAGINLKEIPSENPAPSLAEKKAQIARFRKLARRHRCIDDPIVKEIEELLRSEIARLEKGEVELHEAPLYVRRMWNAVLGYRDLLEVLSVAPEQLEAALATLREERREGIAILDEVLEK